MPQPPLHPEIKQRVIQDLQSGAYTRDQICIRHGVGSGTVSRIRLQLTMLDKGEIPAPGVTTTGYQFRPPNTPLTVVEQKYEDPDIPAVANKKTGVFDWREAVGAVKVMQDLKKKMSWTQDEASIQLGDGKSPVIFVGFGDQHIGAYGCDYEAFTRITDEIIETPNLYVALMGDYLEMAIRLRGVLEVTSQVLTPEMQEAFLESWLDDIKHKVAFATWDNHAVMRQEAQGGTSNVKNILSRRAVYHNGIGHSDLKVGSEIYKCAASHKFRGGSMFNRMHAQGRYVRQQASDRELVLMGDIHQWGFCATEEGGNDTVYITGGTLHTNSGYAKRFFSLKTAIHYPCVVLMHDRHAMIPFKSIAEASTFIRGYTAA